MELKPGYKMTEVGVIPEEWRLTPLGSICDVRDGTHESPRFFKDGVPFVTSKNIIDGRLDLENISFISRADAIEFDKRSKVERNDILLSMIGTIGSAALVDFDPVFCIKNVALIKPQKVAATYLIYLIKAPSFQKYLEGNLDGGIQKFISLGKLRQLAIPLPTESEQRAIAQALSDVDALLAALDQMIAKKRDLKQAAMQQLLTGKTRLPGFSGEWKTLPAREIGFFKGGSGFPLSAQGETGGEYPFFKVSDMNNEGNETFMTVANHYISEQTRTRLGATAFPPDSIVFAKVGAAVFLERKRILGQTSCIDNNMAAFVLDKSRVDVGYIHALLLSKKLSALVTTTALPALNSKQLGEMPLAVPTLPEQSAIAAVLSDMDAELSALESRRDKTRNIKQAMMQELLTGKTRLV
jgi:type I restriction enzyme, S subunit